MLGFDVWFYLFVSVCSAIAAVCLCVCFACTVCMLCICHVCGANPQKGIGQ